MKILQITYSDRGSEAAECALCLHRAFRKIGAGSILLTAEKHTAEQGVEVLPGRWGRLWDRLLGRNLEMRSSGLPEIVKTYNADAVILYDLSGGVASIEEISCRANFSVCSTMKPFCRMKKNRSFRKNVRLGANCP